MHKRFQSMMRAKRTELKLTQQQLADRAGVTKNYVTMLERGARKGVSLMVKVFLADALGIPYAPLLTEREMRVAEILLRAQSVSNAEMVAWALKRYLEGRGRGRGGTPPPGTKLTAGLALQTVIEARPEQRKEMEQLRARLNEIYG